MMSGAVPPLVYEGNLGENFKQWSQRLNIYLTANELDKASEQRKIAILLNFIGSKGITIYNTFTKEEKDTFDCVVEKFEKHFSPRKNLMILRNDFFLIQQNGGERLDEYFTKVINLGRQCELGELQEKLIASKIIAGLDHKYDDLKTKLISEDDDKLSLDYVTTYLKNAEASRLYVRGEIQTNQESEVLVIQNKRNQRSSSTIKNCRNCGKTHPINKCPAYGKPCYNCNRNNHFSNMCMKKKVHLIQQEDEQLDEASGSLGDHFFIGLANVKSSGNEITQNFYIKDHLINVKMDTGAGCNIIGTE
ncbi:uncharacterized protein [Choristoneura fumiferana]|uniref:uncharacterized protein n=1 Tax=Choristoneura fumiferana TaxID=7141 RepID=UPI003D15910E